MRGLFGFPFVHFNLRRRSKTQTLPPRFKHRTQRGRNSVTFVLQTAPSSLDFVDGTDGIFGIDTVVTVNGSSLDNSQIAFFGPALGGGRDLCLK